MSDHYIECTNRECAGCLPTDDAVRAMSVGAAKEEAQRRGYERPRASETKQAILDDADDYRARSAEARALL